MARGGRETEQTGDDEWFGLGGRRAWVVVLVAGCLALAGFSSPGRARAEDTDDGTEGEAAGGGWTDWPDHIDPLQAELPGGDLLGVGFVGQLRLTSRFGPDADRATVVRFPRVRLFLFGAFVDRRLRFQLHLSTAPSSLELFDLWFQWAFRDDLRLRIGQMLTPFTSYRLIPFSQLVLTEWGLNTRIFGSNRQIGALLTGGAPGAPVDGQLGVYTGQSARPVHGVGTIDVYGERPTNPSDLVSPASPEPVHPELIGMVAHAAADLDRRAVTDARGGAFRGMIAASGAWDLRPDAAEDLLLRFALETLVKAHGWGLTALGYAGWFEPTERSGVYTGALGALIEVDRRIFDRFSVAARYALEERLPALIDDARARAQRLALESPDDPGAQERLVRAGRLRRRHETGAGINAYLIGHQVLIQLDAIWIRQTRTEQAGGGTEDDVLMRFQFQLQL